MLELVGAVGVGRRGKLFFVKQKNKLSLSRN